MEIEYNKELRDRALALLEIAYLETVKRPEISRAIAEARDKGDLSENAEYDAAKEAQGLLEMKIDFGEDACHIRGRFPLFRSARYRRVWLFPQCRLPCGRAGRGLWGWVPNAHIHLVPVNTEADLDFRREKLKPAPERMAEIASSIAENFK